MSILGLVLCSTRLEGGEPFRGPVELPSANPFDSDVGTSSGCGSRLSPSAARSPRRRAVAAQGDTEVSFRQSSLLVIHQLSVKIDQRLPSRRGLSDWLGGWLSGFARRMM